MKIFSQSSQTQFRNALAASLLTLGIICEPVHAALEKGVANGVPYAVGGWGVESRQDLSAQASAYSVTLVFAQKHSGYYLADVALRVWNAQGAMVVALDNAGPIVLLGLKPGRYRVNATHLGKTHTREIKIGAQAHRQAVFYWTEKGAKLPGSGVAAATHGR